MANNTDYGLSGSVWTNDENRGKEIASKIDSGVIWVNTWLHRDLRTPFGGRKIQELEEKAESGRLISFPNYQMYVLSMTNTYLQKKNY